MCEDAPYFKKISQSGVEQQEEMNTQRSKPKFNIKLIMKKKNLPTAGASYESPSKTSGAEYARDPHEVSSF